MLYPEALPYKGLGIEPSKEHNFWLKTLKLHWLNLAGADGTWCWPLCQRIWDLVWGRQCGSAVKQREKVCFLAKLLRIRGRVCGFSARHRRLILPITPFPVRLWIGSLKSRSTLHLVLHFLRHRWSRRQARWSPWRKRLPSLPPSRNLRSAFCLKEQHSDFLPFSAMCFLFCFRFRSTSRGYS